MCQQTVMQSASLPFYPDSFEGLHIVFSVQVGGAGLAVMDDPNRGIQFGAEGLSIPLTGGTQARAAKCRLGTYYARNSCLPAGGRSLFAKDESLKGTELLSLKVEHS